MKGKFPRLIPNILEIEFASFFIIPGRNKEGWFVRVGPLTSKVLIKIKQRTQFLAELLKALMTKIMSSANIKWLKLLERFLLKPGTKSRERALFRLTVRFWETRRKRRGGNRVPLTNASGTLNPRSVVAIKNKKEGSRGEARLNPSYPIIWKIHSLEGSNNNRPFNNIKCFFYIYFVNHLRCIRGSVSRLRAISSAAIMLL